VRYQDEYDAGKKNRIQKRKSQGLQHGSGHGKTKKRDGKRERIRGPFVLGIGHRGPRGERPGRQTKGQVNDAVYRRDLRAKRNLTNNEKVNVAEKKLRKKGGGCLSSVGGTGGVRKTLVLLEIGKMMLRRLCWGKDRRS